MLTDMIKARLREELRASGLTTVEIARRVGVSPEMITQYATTKKLPKLDTFARLCKELDFSADYILGLKDGWGASVFPHGLEKLPAEKRGALSVAIQARAVKISMPRREDLFCIYHVNWGCIFTLLSQYKPDLHERYKNFFPVCGLARCSRYVFYHSAGEGGK